MSQDRSNYSDREISLERIQTAHHVNNLSHQDFLANQLRNPEFAAHYLATYLDDGTPEEIADALSKIIRARRNADRPKIYEHLFQENRDSFRQSSVA